MPGDSGVLDSQQDWTRDGSFIRRGKAANKTTALITRPFYVTPIKEVIDDIEATLGCSVSLPDENGE